MSLYLELDNDTSKPAISLTGTPRVLRECVAILFWLYVIVKLFVFDVDVWVLDQFSPGLGRVLHYKLFAVMVALAVSWMILGRKRFAGALLYILGHPVIVFFWKLPVLAFKRWPLVLAFGPVIYRTVATLPTTVLYYTLAALSALIILVSTESALLMPAMVGLAAFLGVHLYRSFRNAYGVSIMANLSSVLKKFRDWVGQGIFDSAQMPNTAPQAVDGAEKPRDPSTLYLGNNIVDNSRYFNRTVYVTRSSFVRDLAIASRHARYAGGAAVPPSYKNRSAEQFASRY